MNTGKLYELPRLNYEYSALEPYISEEQLRIHHQKHHKGYVNGANTILEKLNKARIEDKNIDMKSVLKELSFNIGGHIFKILMALDVWEHAYYLDYKNERTEFVEAFWNIVNWDKVEQRVKNLNCTNNNVN